MTGKGVRLCYYLYYYGILLCIIKEGRSDEGRELQVYINQGGGEGVRQGWGGIILTPFHPSYVNFPYY